MTIGFYREGVAVALAACLAVGCGARAGHDPIAVRGARRIMGASWRITVHAADQGTGERAVAAALVEVERLEKVLSDYDPESELARLSAAAPTPEPVAVSEDLWRVLSAAEDLRRRSAGAFDITVGPLTALWRQARRSGNFPRADKLAAARAAVGEDALELLPASRGVRLPKAGTRLDPGGIGMGYAADRALEILVAHGIGSAMIDASGDILVSGPPPGRPGWRILIAPLRPGGDDATITITHAAVTTSGDAYQAAEIDGVRYSHIVDPRTGLGVAGPTAVTVIAPDATTADALATAASVLGPAQGSTLVGRSAGASARFVWQEGTEIRVVTTPGWPGESGPP